MIIKSNLYFPKQLQILKEKYLFIIKNFCVLNLILLISSLSNADIQKNWKNNKLQIPKNEWSLTTEAIGYLYNYEWFKQHGGNGQTLFGNIIPIYANRNLSDNVNLYIGAIGFIKYGDQSQNTVNPLFRLDIDLTKYDNFIFGALNQTHNIHPALSIDNDLFKQQLAQGIQFTRNSNHQIDTWANWKTAETKDLAEYFEVAWLHNWTFTGNNSLSYFIDDQLFVTHKGGQNTNDNKFIKGEWVQLAIGASLKNQKIALKTFASKYEDELINSGQGLGAEITYSNNWQINSNTKLEFKANHYISNNYYNPNAHPGYNQETFTQFNVDAHWLKNDIVNISTGMSLDWINHSFSTVQYLNISLVTN